MPITKHNFLVTDPDEIPRAIAEAFHIACTGRPGPVLVDIAKDGAAGDDHVRLADRARPARLPPGHPAARQADPRGGPADRSSRAGRCSTSAAASSGRGASQELRTLAELTGIPVVTTLMARGAFPDSHPQHLGMPGMHGTVAAVAGAAEERPDHQPRCPLRRPGHRQPRLVRAGRQGHPRRHRPGRDRQEPRWPTCRSSAMRARSSPTWSSRCRPSRTQGTTGDYEGWVKFLAGVKHAVPAGLRRPRTTASRRSTSSSGSARSPGPRRSTSPASASTRCGPPSSSTTSSPNTWLNSGGLGTMGFAVPAAMGAKVGRPDAHGLGDRRRRLLPDDQPGAGHLRDQRTSRSRSRSSTTSPRHGAPVADAVLRRPLLQHRPAQAKRVPDFVKLAEAYGAVGLRCEQPDDVDATIEKAMEINDVPVVIDFRRAAATRWCGRWSPPAVATTRSSTPATSRPSGRRTSSMSHAHALASSSRTSPVCWPASPACSRRRGFNIDSLAVGPTEHPEISRMTVVVDVEDSPLEQVTKQLNKLIDVIKIVELDAAHSVQRELLLVKVARRPRPAVARARGRPAVPRQGRRRRPRRRHHRGDRRRRQARALPRACSSRSASASSSSPAWSRSAAAAGRSPTAACARVPSPTAFQLTEPRRDHQ